MLIALCSSPFNPSHALLPELKFECNHVLLLLKAVQWLPIPTGELQTPQYNIQAPVSMVCTLLTLQSQFLPLQSQSLPLLFRTSTPARLNHLLFVLFFSTPWCFSWFEMSFLSVHRNTRPSFMIQLKNIFNEVIAHISLWNCLLCPLCALFYS